MKKGILQAVRKRWLSIWLGAVLIALCALTVWAAYETGSNTMKRVIMAFDEKKAGFTSNYLAEADDGTYIHRTLYRAESSEKKYNAEIVLRNYYPDTPDYSYEKDIVYTISISLTDGNGTPVSDTSRFKDKSVRLRAQDSSKANLDITLSGDKVSDVSVDQTIASVKGKPGDIKYVLEFENWDIEGDADIYVLIEARLDNEDHGKYPDLNDIGCRVNLRKNTDNQRNGWEAYIVEQRDLSEDAEIIDGYNLVLTGSGAADITIRWDTSKISLNQFFRGVGGVFDLKNGEVEYTPAPDGDTWATLVVHADANDADREYRNYYKIQVYSASGALDDDFFEVLTSKSTAKGENSLITVNVEGK